MDKNIRHNPDLPVRQSLRLPTYDYTSNGAYFITICTEKRQPIFAISELHKRVLEEWLALSTRFPAVTLDEFVIMSDHIHGIIWLKSTGENTPGLGKIVGAYKLTTTLAWLNYHKSHGIKCSKHLWQRNYYEHVIRNDQDLDQKRQYILDNPMKKQEQEENV